jgi:enterochelin esterase-like enzyme
MIAMQRLHPDQWSLVTGWLPVVITIAGAGALIVLMASRRRRFWTRMVPIVALACLGLVLLFDFLVEVVWSLFPDPLPVDNLVWGWVGLVGVGLAAARMASLSWWGRGGAVLAALVVVVVAAAQVNVSWGLYPTVHAALDEFRAPVEGLPPSAGLVGPVVTPLKGKTLVESWQPPPGMPDKGTVSEVTIPGSFSHFIARRGFVYLPPAYTMTPRPLLPVIVLLAGQPGAADNWINWLQLPATMDAFARDHKGLAPVVVMPDDLGESVANPLCVDSPLGNVETYLARDVPTWIRSTLQAATDRKSWFIGGYSHGGTCSLQLAVRAPQIYGGFMDFSGQREPTLGNRRKTLDRAFGGSEAAFMRINPLDIMRHNKFPDTAGFMVAGTADGGYEQQREVFDACRTAGMDVQWLALPGNHTPEVWRPSLARALPWVAARSGLAAMKAPA